MSRWQPRLVALDIDGTLLAWAADGTGTTEATITRPVHDAVQRVLDAGVPVVLASGRSAHGMVPLAEALELPRDHADPVWIVASNGAVVFRYPPFELVHEDVFDPREAVAAVLAVYPEAIVAVEDRDQQGYRANRPFPTGELSGALTIAPTAELVAEPVSRVIIRDPTATAEDFVALAAGLGLHGTDYVVGWTAWLDLTPVGVSKASGLARVAEALGVDRADVLALGDGRNDIEMLRWAGRGVAMGQAVQPVRDAADAVTGPVAEDGAAQEIGLWFRDASSLGSSTQGF